MTGVTIVLWAIIQVAGVEVAYPVSVHSTMHACQFAANEYKPTLADTAVLRCIVHTAA